MHINTEGDQITNNFESSPVTDKLPQGQFSNVRHVIAIMSGKGGVGKSSVTALLATTFARQGYKVGVLDADITGPSIPKVFGIKEKAKGNEFAIFPAVSDIFKIPIMSINLLLSQEDDPVVWRGPLISNVVRQFWTDVKWGDLDFLFVDLPPGTGDAPLTVMQSLPLDGIVIVSSPQDLAIMVVKKAIKMARMLQIPILGLVENMSYVICPHCGQKYEVFGTSKGQTVSKAIKIPLLTQLPIDPKLSELCDKGRIEDYNPDGFNGIVDIITKHFKGSEKINSNEPTSQSH
ncbi:MAG: Mrp/NBP35 family ATP-binding protein [Acetomicrobium sp.]